MADFFVTSETGMEVLVSPATPVSFLVDGALIGAPGPAGPTGLTGPTGPTGAAGVGVPAGGTSGQVLAKNSNTDYDTHWVTDSGGGGGMANPMTTLGDIIYENGTPAATRLAGNTTATKQFLTQTGTGSASAAPAWGALAAGDIPNIAESQVTNLTSDLAVKLTNPMTTLGDIIIAGSSGVPLRLGIGSAGQVIAVVSGSPAWISKYSGYVNVKDAQFGAKGDGSTDDTSAVNSAITFIKTMLNGMGVLYFPEGTYMLNPASLNSLTTATGSASGYGILVKGAGRHATQLKKNAAGNLLTWNGNGGPAGNNTAYGGIQDITLQGNNFSGALVQTNSAQQMFFSDVATDFNPDVTWDLNTMQDSYWHQVTANNSGSTTKCVFEIYGSANGTSNMLWFDQVRLETFLYGAVHIYRGTGATGGGNNGFFFNQCKFETVSVNGDFILCDGYTQQLYMDQIFFAANSFNGAYSTKCNLVTFGDGSTGSGGNQASFTNIWAHGGTGVLNSVINLNIDNANHMDGNILIDQIYTDVATIGTAIVVGNHMGNMTADLRGIHGEGATNFGGDGTLLNGMGVAHIGNQLGVASSLLGFYGATPIAQPSGEILTALANLGLISSPTISPNDVLPSQTGNSGKYLTTNGSTLSWGSVSSGGISHSINSVSVNTTAGAAANTDYVYFVSGASVTLTLPTAVGNTNLYTIKNTDATHNITLATTSSQTIDDSTTASLTPNTSLDVVSDGTNWRIV